MEEPGDYLICNDLSSDSKVKRYLMQLIYSFKFVKLYRAEYLNNQSIVLHYLPLNGNKTSFIFLYFMSPDNIGLTYKMGNTKIVG